MLITVLYRLVNSFGGKNWNEIARHLPGRVGKQCRERWHNHLRPDIDQKPWTAEEEYQLVKLHKAHPKTRWDDQIIGCLEDFFELDCRKWWEMAAAAPDVWKKWCQSKDGTGSSCCDLAPVNSRAVYATLKDKW